MDEDLVQILKERKGRNTKGFKKTLKKTPSKSSKKSSKKPSKKPKNKQESFKKKILKKLFKWSFISVVWLSVVGVLLFFFYCMDLPDVNELDKNLESNSSVRILNSNV